MRVRGSKALLLGVALMVATPQAAAIAQGGPPPAAGTFDGEVALAKGAMMADPEVALRHARSATSLSRTVADVSARHIAEATGQWLESEALLFDDA